MVRYLRIFIKLFKASLMSEMEYKVNFFSYIFFINLWLAINVMFYKSMFSHVDYLGSWGENEALFFVAAFNVVDSLFFLLFFKGIFSLQEKVSKGTFDYIIVKPISGIFLTFFSTFDISRLINLAFSLVLFFVTLGSIKIQPLQLVFFMIMMFNGLIIYASIFLMVNTLSFYIINVYSIFNIFFDMMEFSRMPSVITTGGLRILLKFIIPILFIAGLPCEYLYSKNNYELLIQSSVIAIIFIFVSTRFLNYSIKHYSSASS